MSAASPALPPRIKAAAWVAVGGGVFVLATAIALFVLLDLLYPPRGGWGNGFLLLVADLALLGGVMVASGRHIMRHGAASKALQGVTLALVATFAAISLTNLR